MSNLIVELNRPDIGELKELASLLDKEKAIENTGRNDSLINNLEPQQLLDKLDYHGITLLADHFRRLPKELEFCIPQRKAMVVAADALKLNALKELFNAFKNAKLGPVVLFKGSALAHTVYVKPWLRPRTDSDIIIEPEQVNSFHQILIDAGYRKHFAMNGQLVSYQSTYSKALAGQSVINIDLHWRISNRQILANAFTAAELYNNGANLNQVIPNARIPSAVDSILIASLHRLGHHQNEERLTWLYDIHLLVSSLEPQQWRSLLAKTASKQLAAITLDALEHCKLLFSSEVPEETLNILAKQSQNSEPSQIFLQRGLSEWRYFLSDMKALPRFSEKLVLLKETAFPSRAYIRKRMGTRSAAYGYLKRLILGVRRFL